MTGVGEGWVEASVGQVASDGQIDLAAADPRLAGDHDPAARVDEEGMGHVVGWPDRVDHATRPTTEAGVWLPG